MVMMGGGPELPSKQSVEEKELVLCTLPIPEEAAKKGIAGLQEEYKDLEVKFFESKFGHGQELHVDPGVYA